MRLVKRKKAKKPNETRIENPLVIVFQAEGKVFYHIHPPVGWTHEHYGLLVWDLVRHIAQAMKVGEDDIWEWVERERAKPTSPITQVS
jgi:hypothetical protein